MGKLKYYLEALVSRAPVRAHGQGKIQPGSRALKRVHVQAKT